MIPYKCVVCEGTGAKLQSFYRKLNKKEKDQLINCKACNGTGVLWSYGFQPAYPYYPWWTYQSNDKNWKYVYTSDTFIIKPNQLNGEDEQVSILSSNFDTFKPNKEFSYERPSTNVLEFTPT